MLEGVDHRGEHTTNYQLCTNYKQSTKTLDCILTYFFIEREFNINCTEGWQRRNIISMFISVVHRKTLNNVNLSHSVWDKLFSTDLIWSDWLMSKQNSWKSILSKEHTDLILVLFISFDHGMFPMALLNKIPSIFCMTGMSWKFCSGIVQFS